MKLTHDPEHNIAYLRFREAAEQVETIHLSDELNVDIAADGSLCGIEFLNANQQLSRTSGRLYDTSVYQDQQGEFRAKVVVPAGETVWHAGPFKARSEAEAAVQAFIVGALTQPRTAA